MSVNEETVSKKYRILTDEVNNIYDRISWWKLAEDVELDSGDDLETTLESMDTIIDASIADMGSVESSSTASQAYVVGQMLVYDNQLYKVIAAIASGDTLTEGTNIEATSVSDLCTKLTASDGTQFYFDVVDGTYGFYTDADKTTFVSIT